MLELHRFNHYLQLLKELCETIMFASFSQEYWHVLFEHFLEHLFLPVIALGFLINTVVAVIEFNKKITKTSQDTMELTLQILSAISIITAITIKVTKIAFAFGPHVFLLGVGLGIMATACKLVSLLVESESERITYEDIGKQAISLITKMAVFSAVFITFINPISPVLLIMCTLSASLLIGAQFINHLLNPQIQSGTKMPGFFNERKIVEKEDFETTYTRDNVSFLFD